MIMKYCRIIGGNFGDDLNTLLWPRLFPDLAAQQQELMFYGIGTLLDGRHDPTVKKVVLGTGIGEAGATMPDCNWEFRWVRGPLTAREFDLPAKAAIGDSAILWPELALGASGHPQGPIGLIPHYRTWDSFDWSRVAVQADMLAINPRQTPAEVLAQMRGCSRIMTESLHGAICADAMGIPWAPCVLAHRFNEFKWKDWLATVGRDFSPFVADRPLVRTITRIKSLANRLAYIARYKQQTRRPSLRPVAVATAHDVSRVAEDLAAFAGRHDNFASSPPALIKQQKEKMLALCHNFAQDYQLRFTA